MLKPNSQMVAGLFIIWIYYFLSSHSVGHFLPSFLKLHKQSITNHRIYMFFSKYWNILKEDQQEYYDVFKVDETLC